MSLIDRLNRRVLARLDAARAQVMVERDAIRLVAPDGAEQVLRIADLAEAVVVHRDGYAVEHIVLALRFAGGQRVDVAQDDPAWVPLAAALDRSGRTRMPSSEWQVRSIADPAPLSLLQD